MADKEGTGTGGQGIFQTPVANTIDGAKPVTSSGMPKTFDYGNANSAFKDIVYDEKGQGIIQGPGTANGSQIRK